jgi:hypothetical protein
MVNLLADGLSQHTKSILPLYKALVNDTSRASLSNFATTSIALLVLAYSLFYIFRYVSFLVLVSTSICCNDITITINIICYSIYL